MPISSEIREYVNSIANNLSTATEKFLQDFQQGLISAQTNVNRTWNTMNAVVRALLDKGILTEDEILKAGHNLMEEAKQNLKVVKKATEAGKPVDKKDLIEAPIERLFSTKN